MPMRQAQACAPARLGRIGFVYGRIVLPWGLLLCGAGQLNNMVQDTAQRQHPAAVAANTTARQARYSPFCLKKCFKCSIVPGPFGKICVCR